MILRLLLAGAALAAGDLDRECSLGAEGLKRFFAEYAQAYSQGKPKELRKKLTPDFWREFAEFAPAKPGRTFTPKLLAAAAQDEYCLVRWVSVAKGRAEEPPARFRLVWRKGGWLIDGILPEGAE